MARLLGLTLIATLLCAQNNRGTIAGRVTDQLGAPMPRAAVTITNATTHETRTIEAGENGSYTVPQVEPGTYSVAARLDGYGRGLTGQVTVRAGATAQSDVVLKFPVFPGGDSGFTGTQLKALAADVAQHPTDLTARYRFARALFARGEYDQAREQFEKTIELFPDFLPPRLALVQVALSQGDMQKAIASSDALQKVAPDSQSAKVLRAAILVRVRQFADARALLKEVLAANPNNVDALMELGAMNLEIDLHEDAADAFAKAFALDNTNTRALVSQAETWVRRNKGQAAIALLEEQSRKQPERLDLRAELGTLEIRANQMDLAIQEFKSALEGNKGTPEERADLYYRLMVAYARKGDRPQAIGALKAARELAPQNGAILAQLALLLDQEGQRDQAIQTYQELLRIDPDNAVGLNNLAWLLVDGGGDVAEALRLATRAKEILPKSSDVADTLGWIYVKKHMTDEAVALYRKLIATNPRNPVMRYHFAVALQQKGAKEEALGQLEEALQNRPAKEDAARIRELMSKLQ